jgi:hypothetical protein
VHNEVHEFRPGVVITRAITVVPQRAKVSAPAATLHWQDLQRDHRQAKLPRECLSVGLVRPPPLFTIVVALFAGLLLSPAAISAATSFLESLAATKLDLLSLKCPWLCV